MSWTRHPLRSLTTLKMLPYPTGLLKNSAFHHPSFFLSLFKSLLKRLIGLFIKDNLLYLCSLSQASPIGLPPPVIPLFSHLQSLLIHWLSVLYLERHQGLPQPGKTFTWSCPSLLIIVSFLFHSQIIRKSHLYSLFLTILSLTIQPLLIWLLTLSLN